MDSGTPGQPDAHSVFQILVHEHADMLVAYLRTLLGRDPSVDDLFQETMLVAWRQLDSTDPSRPFAPWLRGVARNLVHEHWRKTSARPVVTDPAVLVEVENRFELLAQRPGDSFLERTDRLLDCITRLPSAMRHAIDLVYARNLSLASAAQSIGESLDATTQRVQRARRLLAECLGVAEVGR